MMPLDKGTLEWAINIIEKEIENVKGDFDQDSKELALRRILDRLREGAKYGK